MIRRSHVVGAVTWIVTLEAVLLGQSEYRYERRPIPGEHLVYEMRTRSEGASAELVAKLRLIANRGDGGVQEQIEWLSVAHTVTGPRNVSLAPYDLLANPRRVTAGDDADVTRRRYVTLQLQ